MRILQSGIVALTVVIGSTCAADAAETVIIPALALGEEFTDNIYLAQGDTAAEYITHIIPSIFGQHSAPLWDWKVAYAYDSQYYAHKSYADEAVQKLALKSTVRIVKNVLFLDVRDDAGRTSISAVRNYSLDSPVKNQTDYNSFEISPYASFPLTSRSTATIGYLYQNVTYVDPAAIDRAANLVYANVHHALSEHAGLTFSAYNERIETSATQWSRLNFLLGSRYSYGNGSFLWGRIGRSRTSYEDGRAETHLAWDVDGSHRIASLVMNYETGRSWLEDPYLGELREDRYLASVGRDDQRTKSALSFAVRTYNSNKLSYDEKYSTTASVDHALTERLAVRGALMLDRYVGHPAGPVTTTHVYHADVRFEHRAQAGLTFVLHYRYTNSESPDTISDNYRVNRLVAEARKSF